MINRRLFIGEKLFCYCRYRQEKYYKNIFVLHLPITTSIHKTMNYISVSEFAKKWNIPELTILNYCAIGEI